MSRSNSYRRWLTERAGRLDEMELAHTAIGGTGPGRRVATRQLNHAYAVLLAAEFQGYCRDLHTEAADAFSLGLPVTHRNTVNRSLTVGRLLDRANATPSSLKTDFERLGVKLWTAVDAVADGPSIRRRLDELNAWRNAVAHSDFDPARLGGTILLRLNRVQRWRGNCRRLARLMDQVVAADIQATTGVRPW